MTGHVGKTRRSTKKDKAGRTIDPGSKENGSFPSLPQGSESTAHSTAAGDGTSDDDKIPFQGSR